MYLLILVIMKETGLYSPTLMKLDTFDAFLHKMNESDRKKVSLCSANRDITQSSDSGYIQEKLSYRRYRGLHKFSVLQSQILYFKNKFFALKTQIIFYIKLSFLQLMRTCF